MHKRNVGEGKVVLIAGGGRIFTDVAARFVGSKRDLDAIAGSEYSKQTVQNILDNGHMAALEFDNFIFGFEGYSRVLETQLVRKRHASFMIKSGRVEPGEKYQLDAVIPPSLNEIGFDYNMRTVEGSPVTVHINTERLLLLNEAYVQEAIEQGVAAEDARYMAPQATATKGIMSINAHGLHDYFKIRCCKNAQWEHQDLANKMLKLCLTVAPDLFKDAGPSCKVLGYCPEKTHKNPACDNVISKAEAMGLIKNWRR